MLAVVIHKRKAGFMHDIEVGTANWSISGPGVDAHVMQATKCI